jgi:hypothetical protein
MGKMLREGQFFPHFALIYRTIIVNVCFVLLARSEDQIEQFEIDQGIFRTSQDICDAHENDVYSLVLRVDRRPLSGLSMMPDFYYILHDAGARHKYHELTGRHDYSVPVKFAQISSYLTSPRKIRFKSGFWYCL